MKYFKCGNCQTPYKIDEQKITTVNVTVLCIGCGAKNLLRFGPVLTAHSKTGMSQFSLKEGVNIIGRKSNRDDTTVKIEDPFISKKHASILVEQKDGKVFISIEDLGSLNGTFNKNKIKIKTALKYPFTKDDYFILGLTKISINY